MMLVAEVPGGRRARILMFALIAFGALSVRCVDRVVTEWFDGMHFPDPVVPSGPHGTEWDERSMWR
jgi:hypothetical protein